MTNKFNINVTGGNAAIGAASQGDANKVSGTASVHAQTNAQFDAAAHEIQRLAAELSRSKEELQAALDQLSALKDKTTAEPRKTEEAKGILKTISENLSWAFPVVKEVIKVAWPALLTVV